MRVLVGVDGSNGSMAAIRFACKLLTPGRDHIHLYYSPPSMSISVHRGTKEKELLKRVQAALTARIFERSIAEFSPELRNNIETIAGTKDAGNGLLVAADEYRSDMIVVGSHGTSLWERLTLGSVSRAVAHRATIAVLIVRDQEDQASADGLRVLLAYDRSDSCNDAKAFLNRLTWPDNTTGEVLTTFESFAGQIPEWLAEELRVNESEALHMGTFESTDEDREKAQQDLEFWRKDLPPQFLDSKPRVGEGRPSQRILDVLNAERFDLVVLGAHRRGAIGRAFVGSTSDYVMNRAPCSVLLIREHEKA